MKRALFTTMIALMLSAAVADDGAPEIKHLQINVFPNDVIVVKAKMLRMAELRDHLKALIPDARKPVVSVTVIPHTKKEMTAVAKIVAIARDLGFRKVTYEGPKPPKVIVGEVQILVSKTGEILVNNLPVKEEKLSAHLEALVAPERRATVPVTVHASRKVKFARVTQITKLCRSVGFKKVTFHVIPE